MTNAETEHAPSDPLLLLMSAVCNRGLANIFTLFPELSADAMVDRLFVHWRDMADRGAFRDAVQNIIGGAPDDVQQRAFGNDHRKARRFGRTERDRVTG